LVIKDRSIINEMPATEPIIKRMIRFSTTMERGIKKIFPKISSFKVVKTLCLIKYLLMFRLHRILTYYYTVFQV
jgi:hypothetical protein